MQKLKLFNFNSFLHVCAHFIHPKRNHYYLFSVGVSGIKKRSSGLFGLDGAEPDWTAAVEQLAWEKDLNLSGGGVGLQMSDFEPAPLDQVDTPPAEHGTMSLGSPPTEFTNVSS